MKFTLLVSGTGGQGIVSAGLMLAQAATESGKHATFVPLYGPEQRGGSAKCTVIIDDTEVLSPLPKKCEYFISMNELSLKKFGGEVKDGGLMILNSNRCLSEVTNKTVTVISAPVDDIAIELGNAKVSNIITIGILLGATNIIELDVFKQCIAEKFAEKKPEITEVNFKALDRGYEIGKKGVRS